MVSCSNPRDSLKTIASGSSGSQPPIHYLFISMFLFVSILMLFIVLSVYAIRGKPMRSFSISQYYIVFFCTESCGRAFVIVVARGPF